MKVMTLESGEPFRMGKGLNWRVVHPDMGASQLTLNHGLHAPGQEFTQHVHGEPEDLIVVLEGGGSLRQGERYTSIRRGEAVFVPGGEVHGTVNTTGESARLMSFQSPPDMALYRGERDRGGAETPRPPAAHRSAVQIVDMSKGGPVFGRPGDWREVISPARGSRYLGIDFIRLPAYETFDQEPGGTEEIYVVVSGAAGLTSRREQWQLDRYGVVFLAPGDGFGLAAAANGVSLVRCYAVR
jgi:mannose-6-phosphate isomerase-like protein (cupin superfamily)